MKEKSLKYELNGFSIIYTPHSDSSVTLEARSENAPIEITFAEEKIDEAHILYMESTELIQTRMALNQSRHMIYRALEILFSLFRGEKVPLEEIDSVSVRNISSSPQFAPNPGKKIGIDVDGTKYLRLPVKTRFIGPQDTDILPLIKEYAVPHMQPGDLFFVSEKALTVTQGRVVNMHDIKPSWLAKFLSKRVANNYGSDDFRGFGHGTSIAMQLLIDEAGYVRVLFAAAVSAITRPFGIRGLFYALIGKRAKSIDCPMSFLILEYAHSAKLAPDKPNEAARRIRDAIGAETVILDANYRGAFSLGTSGPISESFIQKLFRDNPLGQSDEMTPFCIVRKA